MSNQQSTAFREVFLTSPAFIDERVRVRQKQIELHIAEYTRDVCIINQFIERWRPLPSTHQFVANRMARLAPELEAFLQQLRESGARATRSRSALMRVEKDLTWYSESADAKRLLAQTLAECRDRYEPEFERTLMATERTTLGQIHTADEDFFKRYLDASRPPLTVYRGDGRGVTADTRANDARRAIVAGGRRDVSFFGVVQHVESSTNKNGMVSTTTDRAQALDWALDGKNHGLLYTLRVTRYIDTIALLRQRNFKHRFATQFEVLVPDQIPESEIVSVELFNSERVLLGAA